MRATLILLLLGLLYLSFWPVPVAPLAYVPDDSPGLVGKFATNDMVCL